MSTASTSLQNTTSSCLNWSSFVLGLLTDSNYNIDASFGISKSARNIINVTWRFSLFSSASVKLNWATTSLLLLPSPHPSPCSLQDVVFLGARCYKHSSENKTALWFHPHLLQASLTAPGNCSGTTNCCRALHGFTNREKLWLPLISPLKGYKTWCISSTSLFSYITFTRDCRCN